jgi:hypothetical protein
MRNRHFAHFAGVSRLTDQRVKDLLEQFVESAKAAYAASDCSRPRRLKRTYKPTKASKPIKARSYSNARVQFMGAFSDTVCALLDSMAQVTLAHTKAYERESRVIKGVINDMKRVGVSAALKKSRGDTCFTLRPHDKEPGKKVVLIRRK